MDCLIMSHKGIPHKWKCYYCLKYRDCMCFTKLNIHVCFKCYNEKEMEIEDMNMDLKNKEYRKLEKMYR